MLAATCFAAVVAALAWPTIALSTDHRGFPGYFAATDAPLSGWGDPRLQRREGEADLALAGRLTQQVFASTYHCQPSYIDQTWATAIAGRMSGAFAEQGILTPGALRCGFCHQVAFILAEALARAGIDATAYALGDHVVTVLRVGGREYVADADLGTGPYAVDWGTQPVWSALPGQPTHLSGRQSGASAS